jgi:tetratricopeptide (TPR) repeat protein
MHLVIDKREGVRHNNTPMAGPTTVNDEAQLAQTIEMFEVITQSQPLDYQSLEILKEAYYKLGRQKDVVNTSKRIAQAYVQLGQLSSAILEYESILQRYPEDPDVKAALLEIESKAGNFVSTAAAQEGDLAVRATPGQSAEMAPPTEDVDDGRLTMEKLFVEGRLLSLPDFNLYWKTPALNAPAGTILEPFIQVLADKGLVPLERSLKLVCERSRLPFLPLDKYDIDVDVARGFPREICHRWCILPFDRMSKSVQVATANPFNRQVVAELEQATRSRLLWYLCPPAELVRAIRKMLR